jgi:hypothetical protein
MAGFGIMAQSASGGPVSGSHDEISDNKVDVIS